MGASSCCSQAVDGYCKEGEGDCDDDSECEGELVCGFNNCAWNSTFDDCCAKPGKFIRRSFDLSTRIVLKPLKRQGHKKYL